MNRETLFDALAGIDEAAMMRKTLLRLLRTVSVRDWNELLILGAVILLRAALTFLIHWEIGLETRKTEGPAEDPGKR